MNVNAIMSTEVVAVTPDTPLKEAAATLTSLGISGLLVVDEERRLLGVLSETDVVTKEAAGDDPDGVIERLVLLDVVDEAKLAARSAGDAMTSPPITIEPHRSVHEAAVSMLKAGVSRLPVVEDGVLVGIVTRADLVRAFTRPDAEIRREIESEVILGSRWPAIHVDIDQGVVTLAAELQSDTDAKLLLGLVRAVPGVVSVVPRFQITGAPAER